MSITERQLQHVVVEYLQLRGWYVLQTYLGSNRGGSVWMTSGIPDIYAVKKGRAVWLELKTASGKLTPAQQNVHARLLAAGAEVYVVRSLDDVIKIDSVQTLI